MTTLLLLGDEQSLKLGVLNADGSIHRAGVIHRDAPELFGSIVKAKITKAVSGMGGSFVEFRDFEGLPKEGFLKFLFPKNTPSSKQDAYSKVGQQVWAQIDRDAQKGKPFRLKPYLGSDEDLPKKGPSRLEVWAERYPNAEIVGNIEAVHWVPEKLKERFKIASAEQITEFKQEFELLTESECDLGDGWSAIIVPTPSLVAIDLNHVSGGNFEGNLSALMKVCDEVAKRDLSGSIFVDLAGISLAKRRALGKVFQEALLKEKNPDYPRYEGVAPRGMIELYRPQKRRSIMEVRG